MRRKLLLAILSVVACTCAQEESSDPAFSRVPFDEWLKRPNRGPIGWRLNSSRPFLSVHQRLAVELEIQVDGSDLVKRAGRGQLVTLFQLVDAGARVYRAHGSIDLAKVQPDASSSYIGYTQQAFILPGEYRLTAAIYDDATGEHGVRQVRLRVPPLRNDPLPSAWHQLPSVEFIEAAPEPDLWYLPKVAGRLSLPVAAKRRVRIEAIANISPSERPVREHTAPSWHPWLLIPALKNISQIDVHPGTMNVELVDVLRRRIVFRQNDVRELNWEEFELPLGAGSTEIIDLKSLEDRNHGLAFLLEEIGKRMAGEPDEARVIILLSNKIEFALHQDVSSVRLAAVPGCRVFYIRVVPPETTRFTTAPPLLPRVRRLGVRRPRPLMTPEPVADQIEPALKPLAPKLIEVSTPEELRKALATIMAEIAGM